MQERKSVLAVELFALVDVFDIAMSIKDCFEKTICHSGAPLVLGALAEVQRTNYFRPPPQA